MSTSTRTSLSSARPLATIQDTLVRANPIGPAEDGVVRSVVRAGVTGTVLAGGLTAYILGVKAGSVYGGDASTWLAVAPPLGLALGSGVSYGLYAAGVTNLRAGDNGETTYGAMFRDQSSKASALRVIKVLSATVPAAIAVGITTGLVLTGTHVGAGAQVTTLGLVGGFEAIAAGAGFAETSVRRNLIGDSQPGHVARRPSPAERRAAAKTSVLE